jgi:signal transduction histidine kinase
MLSAHAQSAMVHESGRGRVLIVDDEFGVRESLRAILSSDLETLTASSGDEALAIAQLEPIDVVTLDLRMPGMGGIAVLEQLKRIDPDVEVLIITGYGSFDTAVEGLRFRAFDYLAKPFDVDRVRKLVRAALARRLAVRHIRAAPEQLLGTLSHEFRTPLNVIMGYSTMLRDESTLSDEQRAAIDRIHSNSTALLSYVESLFYMAELDRGAVPLAVARICIASVLDRLAVALQGEAGAKGITLTIESEPGLELSSDEDKVLRLLRALADNAIRHALRGAVTVRAEATRRDEVVFEIRDAGPGIAPEVVAEVEAVAAGAATEPPRRLGFGLRLVGRLVRTLGARLSLSTGPAGTAVRITVPSLAAGDVVRIAPAA